MTITTDPIDEGALAARRRVSEAAGAAVSFLGFVRGAEDGAPIEALEYEVFERMAERQLGVLFDEIERRWPVESIRLVHRVGPVPVGAPSLWIEVVGPHRAEAFAACQWLIDELKRVVPIWKRPVPRPPGDGPQTGRL